MDWKLVLNIVLLIVGMALLVKGADFFVDGASNIAKALKIPSLIIGLTLVSMGTSAPEVSVGINSALSGMKGLSIGNIVGANILNTFFILGISAVIIPIAISSDMKKLDIPILIGIYVLLLIFSFVLTPGTLDRLEGIIMLVLFVAYMVFLVLRAKKSGADNPEENSEKKKQPIWLSIILTVVGLAGIVFGGELVVNNASELAIKLGMSELLVGLTIVAIGTTLPELVTSVVAALRKEEDIAVGNVIGSNIFNTIFILGITSTISPLSTEGALVDMVLLLCSGLILLLIALFCKKMSRWQGILMILVYLSYLTYIILRNYIIV